MRQYNASLFNLSKKLIFPPSVSSSYCDVETLLVLQYDIRKGRIREASAESPEMSLNTHLLKIHFKPYDNVLITSAGVSGRYYPADVLKTSVGNVSWYCLEGNMGTFLERRFLFNWIVKLDSDNKRIHNLFEFCWLLIPAPSRENSLVPLQEVVFATSDLT